ncbi:dehydrogenase [Hypericibacter adhaerens]|uniref:Dehydrogenase n=1 Tax=Hypericibacter adhaerens TaxID=2602016 RepID=A0A5J6MVZ7_9PROT|nr:SDR family oxidoreductase [Hypericibacter adhaerens]QEX21842.1 dehydrogenase [Hypericibacter adhaerens]
MRVEGKVVAVTGGASGIGRALCQRFHKEGAAKVVVADLDVTAAEAVAAEIEGAAFRCDVSDEAQIARLVTETEDRFGPIDLFCSNAGIATFDTRPRDASSASNAAWERSWAVNVMAHVYAARALTPRMAARGGGYFLHTVSAAGLLSQIGGAVYATTKHAAIGFAEALAIAHRDAGIRVSVLCPQGVDTPMLRALPDGPQARDGVISAEAVADCVIEGLAEERFLILPHPVVADYMRRKTADYDRWLSGMVRLRRTLEGDGAPRD